MSYPTVPCQYKTGKVLGKGTYAMVKEAQHISTGQYFAVKVINKKLMEGREHMVRNEINILKKVSQGHKNIVTLVDYFETVNNLYLVTDLATGGELFERICTKVSYDEAEAAHLVRTITEAVAYLHHNGIVHRDLKPENLLFRTPAEDADLLIADFGLSRIIDSDKFHLLTTTCGTPGYMAPEIHRKVGHGKPVDMWAIGVITYFLLCGYPPFDDENDFAAIINADYKYEPAEYWECITPSAKDFINRLLTREPNERMTADTALLHPWLNGYQAQPAQPFVRSPMRPPFNPRRTFRKAVDIVKAIHLMKPHDQEIVRMVRNSQEVDESVDQVLLIP